MGPHSARLTRDHMEGTGVGLVVVVGGVGGIRGFSFLFSYPKEKEGEKKKDRDADRGVPVGSEAQR